MDEIDYFIRKVLYNLKLMVVLIFFAVSYATWTLGPIAAAFYFQDPRYLYTYLISWFPAIFFFGMGHLLSEM